MKGDMSYTATLGVDAAGNIARINNALDRIPQRLKSSEEQLQALGEQMENAQRELGKPFPQDNELTEKSERLTELNVLLNMDNDIEELESTDKEKISTSPTEKDTLHPSVNPIEAYCNQYASKTTHSFFHYGQPDI